MCREGGAAVLCGAPLAACRPLVACRPALRLLPRAAGAPPSASCTLALTSHPSSGRCGSHDLTPQHVAVWLTSAGCVTVQHGRARVRRHDGRVQGQPRGCSGRGWSTGLQQGGQGEFCGGSFIYLIGSTATAGRGRMGWRGESECAERVRGAAGQPLTEGAEKGCQRQQRAGRSNWTGQCGLWRAGRGMHWRGKNGGRC